MTHRTVPVLILLLSLTLNAFGQDELHLYRKIFQKADSLNKIGKITEFDSSIFNKVKELDKNHPSMYYETVGNLLSESKFNEAAFVFYLGSLRYRYYNSANPDYKPGDDGALLASFKMMLGEPVNMYLKTNIENYISILKTTIIYYDEYDFQFYSKKKNIEKYKEQSSGFKELITELEANNEKYQKTWNYQRKEFEQILNEP